MIGRKAKVLLLGLPLLAVGCVVFDDNTPKKPSPTGLIATPPSYYSTAKARYLGAKYKENLDRLVERIVRNPKTSTVQFANNISSVGGIGFFTHSAAKIPDERYLEVVLATPETFETKGELSDKVHRLFSRYGIEILGILSSDSDIYQDKELTGYGLNLAWRNIVVEPAGNRVTLARAIIYLPKDRVRNFLRHEVNQNDLLGNAVIFSVEEDGPLTLVSYQPQELRPDFRPAIREDNLPSVPLVAKSTPAQSTESAPKEPNQRIEPKLEVAKKEPPAAKEVASSAILKPSPREANLEPKEPTHAAQTTSPVVVGPGSEAGDAKEKVKPAQRDVADQVAIIEPAEPAGPGASVNEPKSELKTVAPTAATPPTQAVTAPPAAAKPAAPPTEKNPRAPVSKMEETMPVGKGAATQEEASASLAKKPRVELKKRETDAKRVAEGSEPAANVSAAKSAAELKGSVTVASEKAPETKIESLRSEKPVSTRQKEEKINRQTAETVAGPRQVNKPVTRAVESAPPILPGKASETKQRESIETLAPAATIAKAEAQSGELKASMPLAKPALKEEVARAKPREPAPAESERRIIQDKTSDAKTPDKLKAPGPVGKSLVEASMAESVKAAPLMEPAKAAPPPASAGAGTSVPTAKVPADLSRPHETAKAGIASGAAKIEPPVIAARPITPVPTGPSRESTAEKPASEQMALLRKPAELIPEKKALARPAPKALEGFIIQLGFTDKEKAQRWAEMMERKGYAVSVTEAGSDGALRVRLGNFTLRDDAERQLRTFKQEGLMGIIINLPQSFMPAARSSIP